MSRVRQHPGLPLGRFLGAPVRLAPSWFVIALVVVFVFSPNVERSIAVGPPASYVVAALYAVLLLVSVLVHEFAHAAAARALGLPVHEIVADLWGGHTQFADESPTPGRSALVAVVGPLANAVLALLGYLALNVVDESVPRLLLVAAVISNALVAALNMAPGLPLDGGRIVESLVWAVTGRRATGTVVAGWCGRVLAVVLVLVLVVRPLLAGGRPDLFTIVWTAAIGAMLWQGASSAIAMGTVRARAARLRLMDVTEPAIALPADTATWLHLDAQDPRHVVALAPDGRPVGLLEAAARAALLQHEPRPPDGTPLAAVMTVLQPVVVLSVQADGDEVLQALATSPAHVYVVVDPSGQVVAVAGGGRLAQALTGRPASSPAAPLPGGTPSSTP